EVATPSSQRIFPKATGGEKSDHDDARNCIPRITGVLLASESMRSTISPLRNPWASSFTTAWKLCFGLSMAATSLFHKDFNECFLEHVGGSLCRLRPAERCFQQADGQIFSADLPGGIHRRPEQSANDRAYPGRPRRLIGDQ